MKSAGGMGLLLNANSIKSKLLISAPNTQIKFIIDSAWQLNLPYSYLCPYSNSNSNSNSNRDKNECNFIINKIFNSTLRYIIH